MKAAQMSGYPIDKLETSKPPKPRRGLRKPLMKPIARKTVVLGPKDQRSECKREVVAVLQRGIGCERFGRAERLEPIGES